MVDHERIKQMARRGDARAIHEYWRWILNLDDAGAVMDAICDPPSGSMTELAVKILHREQQRLFKRASVLTMLNREPERAYRPSDVEQAAGHLG